MRKDVILCLVAFLIFDWVTPFMPLGSVLLLFFVITRNQWFMDFIQKGYGK